LKGLNVEMALGIVMEVPMEVAMGVAMGKVLRGMDSSSRRRQMGS
jgi:hypothetical protein